MGAVKDFEDPVSDRLRAVRIHQHGRVTHHFRQRRYVRCDHGSAAGHRLQRRQAEPFVKRRKHEHRRETVEHSERLLSGTNP